MSLRLSHPSMKDNVRCSIDRLNELSEEILVIQEQYHQIQETDRKAKIEYEKLIQYELELVQKHKEEEMEATVG